ncbi:MAG: DUF1993 domain-containing protein, partial [Minisyncoccia bacterium]
FVKTLGGLRTVLGKAREHGLDEASFMEDRLAPDMFPFARQVRSACDNAKGAVARLAGLESPVMEDNEASLEELQARIDKTIAFIQSVPESAYAGAVERRIVLPYFKDKYMTGYDYAREYAIPNFFFHVSMAYALVRRQGVVIGKADYINGMPLNDASS